MSNEIDEILNIDNYEFSFTDPKYGNNIRLNSKLTNQAILAKISQILPKVKIGFDGLEFISFRDLIATLDSKVEINEQDVDSLESYSQTKTQKDLKDAIKKQKGLYSLEVKKCLFSVCKNNPLVEAILRFNQIFPELETQFQNNCYIPDQLILGNLTRLDYLNYLRGLKPFFYFTTTNKQTNKTKNQFYYLINENEIQLIRGEIQKRNLIPSTLEDELVKTWIEDVSSIPFNERFRFNEQTPCPYLCFIGSLNKLQNSYKKNLSQTIIIGK